MPTPPNRNRILLASATLLAMAGVALVTVCDRAACPTDTCQTRGLGHDDHGSNWTGELNAAPFPGLLALGPIRLQPGAVVDTWDSPIGGFLRGHTQHSGKAQVRSVGDIDLVFRDGSPPTVVVGHANPNSGFETRIQKGSFVTGGITPSDAPITLPSLPKYDPQEVADFTLTAGRVLSKTRHLPLGQVRIGGDSSWVLRGPIHLQATSLEFTDQATLIVDASQGPVIVHVTNQFAMGPGTRIEFAAGESGQSMFLVGQGQAKVPTLTQRSHEQSEIDAMRTRLAGRNINGGIESGNKPVVDLQCSGRFHGLLYAPFSKVRIPTDLRFQGTITAASIELGSNAHVTCDPRVLGAWNLLTETVGEWTPTKSGQPGPLGVMDCPPSILPVQKATPGSG
ncbi:MAG: hypothetical protein GY930_15725 [bacterium]|nr:hypothetical protein [bacterium]